MSGDNAGQLEQHTNKAGKERLFVFPCLTTSSLDYLFKLTFFEGGEIKVVWLCTIIGTSTLFISAHRKEKKRKRRRVVGKMRL